MIHHAIRWARNELVYGGHLISLAAVSIAVTPAIVLGIKITYLPLVISYLVVFSTLLYNRYKERETDSLDNPERTAWLANHFRFTLPIMVASALFSIISLLFVEKIGALIFLVFFLLALIFYTKYTKGLTRKIVAFKNIKSSLLMVFLATFLAIYYQYYLGTPFVIMCVFIFLRMMVNTVFQDIKDIKGDQRQNLLTLPIVLGQEKTIYFSRATSLLSAIPILLGVYYEQLPFFSLVLLLSVPYSFYYLEKSHSKSSFYLVNYILADAEFIFWPLLLLAGQILT